MVDPNGMEAVFDAQTGELEHATGKDAQNAFRGLRKTLSRQQNGLRNAKLTVSSAESVNKGYIREATQKDGLTGNIYEVPIYKATLTGTDADGNNQSYDFYVARVGVKNGKKHH